VNLNVLYGSLTIPKHHRQPRIVPGYSARPTASLGFPDLISTRTFRYSECSLFFAGKGTLIQKSRQKQIMKRNLSFLATILFLVTLYIQQAFCCSTFCLKDSNNIIYGRSYDWDIGYGYLMTNLRNINKTRYLPYDETPASWISKYGSVTFNQYGKEYPIGGINETGLVVEVMMLRDIQYPNQDERTAIDELGWVQYQLDNSASIKDVIESDKKIRISNKTFAKLHFLISDISGETLVVEFLNGKASFYYDENLPLPCLTNNTYYSSLIYLKKYSGFGGEVPIDYQNHSSNNSLERFAIISDMLNINFKIITQVSIPRTKIIL